MQAKHLGSNPSDTVMRSISGQQAADPLPATLRVTYQRLDEPFTPSNAVPAGGALAHWQAMAERALESGELVPEP